MIQIVADPKNRALHRGATISAVELLGEMRAEESIDVLVKYICTPYIAYADEPKSMRPYVSLSKGLKPADQRYPAVHALICVGSECTDEVAAKLRENTNVAEMEACIYVLKQLGEFENARASLRHVIDNAPDGLRDGMLSIESRVSKGIEPRSLGAGSK